MACELAKCREVARVRAAKQLTKAFAWWRIRPGSDSPPSGSPQVTAPPFVSHRYASADGRLRSNIPFRVAPRIRQPGLVPQPSYFSSTSPEPAVSKPAFLTNDQRRDIFRALIEAQDAGQSVAESLKATAEKFQVSQDMVKKIEIEGVGKEWPPL